MNFTTWKVKKYNAFRSKLNQGKITSYMDEDLRTEMLAMEQSQGTRNTIIKHAPGYNDDMIDSFIMSCFYYVDDEGGLKTFDFDFDDEEGYKSPYDVWD
jgi:hypothetical protein